MRVLKAAAGGVTELAFSPDGRAVAAAVPHRGVFLWNLDAGAPTPVPVAAGDDHPNGLTFSADGRAVAWLAGGGRRVYDRDTRETSEQSFAVTRGTHAVVQSAGGARVVSQHGLPDHCLIGWRAADDGWVRGWTLSTADLSAQSLTLSADGRLFALLTRATLGNPRWWEQPLRVEVRDAASGGLRGTGGYPYNYADPLLFSPDGRQLVGWNDMTLLAWAVPAEAGPLGPPRRVRNDTRKHFTGMAYHPSGRVLYAASNDTTVHVFDAATWDRAGRFTWHLGPLKAVAVSPDGTLAAAGGDGGDVVVWDLDV